MSFTQINSAIRTEFASNTGVPATALRSSVSAIYLNEAPPGTPYPIIVFEDANTNASYTFCSTLEICPVDFTVYADTKAQSLELGYYIKSLYDNNTLPLSGGYSNIGALYDGQFSDYDQVDKKFFTRTSINYTIQSQDASYIPVNNSTLSSVVTTVQSLSADWASREFAFEFTNPFMETELKTLLLADDVRITGAIATALSAGVSSTAFDVYKNASQIGDIVFSGGSLVGVSTISATDFTAGDKLGIISSTPDAQIELVDITVQGYVY